MSSGNQGTTATHRTRSAVIVAVAIGVAVVVVAVVASLGDQPSMASPPSAALGAPAQPGLADGPGDRGHGLGSDGSVPEGATVFDDEVPAVANLDPQLLDALRRAATDAAGDGIAFSVNSGWRSPEYQDQLLRDAVAEYGSAAEAARWVATADTSPHVHGDAIDLGQSDATAWLSEHGAEYGLCQIYANEPWHYELRPEAIDVGCPTMYADPTYDPRMHE